jgi:S-adenosylmethionine-diacylglycerol 3-amino-3-carboxypropyl transferase
MLALAPSAPQSDSPVVWNRDSILFSACNEDTRSELTAFGSLEGKNVFCVTAGGGRVLSLLLDRPRAITAVDLNPAQNALLELKIAALKKLDHDGYLRFLGVRPHADRLATYSELRRSLSPVAQSFFDSVPDAVESGILFQGKLERFFERIAVVTRLGYPFGLKKLLDSDDIETQRGIMAKVENPIWRFATQTLCRRSVLRLFSGDPGFFRYLPDQLPLHEVLYDRIHGHLKRHLLRDNPLIQLVFFGRYVWEPALPIYLHAETYSRVQSALSETKIELVTSTVHDALAGNAAQGFDAFSLSDISSYLDDDAHHTLFESVLGAANPDARLCSRSNIYHRPLAPEHGARLERDMDIERTLSASDHACVHEFVVGRVRHGASQARA